MYYSSGGIRVPQYLGRKWPNSVALDDRWKECELLGKAEVSGEDLSQFLHLFHDKSHISDLWLNLGRHSEKPTATNQSLHKVSPAVVYNETLTYRLRVWTVFHFLKCLQYNTLLLPAVCITVLNTQEISYLGSSRTSIAVVVWYLLWQSFLEICNVLVIIFQLKLYYRKHFEIAVAVP